MQAAFDQLVVDVGGEQFPKIGNYAAGRPVLFRESPFALKGGKGGCEKAWLPERFAGLVLHVNRLHVNRALNFPRSTLN